MDVRLSEYEKRVIRLGKSLICKKIGKAANDKNIHKYLISTKNEALKEIVEMINFVADKTKNKYQSERVREFGEFTLFIAINHPVYRKILEALLNKFTKYENVKIDLDIKLSRLERFVIEKAINYIIRKMATRKRFQLIMEESATTSNKFAQYFISNIDDALKDIKFDSLVNNAKILSWIAVFIAVNDTAYRHQFYYALNKFGNKKVKEITKEFTLEPDKWYINLYHEGTKETRELWKKNELPRHEVSLIEENCVLSKQKKKINNILKKIGGAY